MGKLEAKVLPEGEKLNAAHLKNIASELASRCEKAQSVIAIVRTDDADKKRQTAEVIAAGSFTDVVLGAASLIETAKEMVLANQGEVAGDKFKALLTLDLMSKVLCAAVGHGMALEGREAIELPDLTKPEGVTIN